jgi:hypothetical protein
MGVTFKWAAGESIATACSADMDSLGSGNTVLSADAIANQTDLYQYIDMEWVMASATSGANPFISIWFLVALDGSNYEDGTAGTPGVIPLRQPDVLIPLRAAVTAAQRVTVCNTPIPPQLFKILVCNNAGVALASSGNTLKYIRHNAQAV